MAAKVRWGGEEGPKTDLGWEVWPSSLYEILMRITNDYERPVIAITENGCVYNDEPDADGVIRDARRIEFFRGSLRELARAIKDGARVVSYHAWSLLDTFEWTSGLEPRFGLVYVDRRTQDRTVKESGRWYADLAQANGF